MVRPLRGGVVLRSSAVTFMRVFIPAEALVYGRVAATAAVRRDIQADSASSTRGSMGQMRAVL
jgi:hypothetical protein